MRRYIVVVTASDGVTSVTSDPLHLVVQTAVRPSRLEHLPSVVQNHSLVFSCRTRTGTNITYSWSFGDGESRTGQSTEQHTFYR